MAAQLSASSTSSSTVQCGPAGSTYESMRSAGRHLLHTHCDNFPDTTKSFVLPPSSTNEFTEPIHQPRPTLTKKEQNQLKGMRINQDGEMHEKIVSDLFVKMIKQIDVSPPILVLKNISIDNDHKCNTRVNTLTSEIPKLSFQGQPTTGENDILVLLKNLGIVLIEVKGSTKNNNVDSAEQQLNRINWFVQCIFRAITGHSAYKFPVVKLIVVPNEEASSPTALTPEGSRLVFKDICDDFNKKWTRLITGELRNAFAWYPFTADEFKELSEIITGLWSSKPVHIHFNSGKRAFGIKYEDSDASLSRITQNIDMQLCTANVTKNLQPLTNIIPTQPSEVFQSSNELNLFYLSPPQRELFDLHKQCILRGAAGTGKTLILVLKVLQLKQTSDFRDILILAPHPHTLRIRNILLKNNLAVEMIRKFPPTLSDHTTQLQNPSNIIYIMNLDDFFLVDTDTLMSYDMSQLHLFLDDFQSLYFSFKEITTSFYDVGDFFNKWYESFRIDERYLWVLMDVVQGEKPTSVKAESSYNFFLTRQCHPRAFNIPIIHLNSSMRNTIEIAKLNNELRDILINFPKVSSLSHVPLKPSMGHKISGQVPTYHILHGYADQQHIISFIIERMRKELMMLSKPPYSLPLSHIAILWDSDDDDLIEYFASVRSFLYSEFNTTPVTIQQQLDTNNIQDIIMDTKLNVLSFESPCVILIETSRDKIIPYFCSTRARTHLTIIDVAWSSKSFTYHPHISYGFPTRARTLVDLLWSSIGCLFPHAKHMHVVHWKRCNVTYIRYNPHREEIQLAGLKYVLEDLSGFDFTEQLETQFGLPLAQLSKAAFSILIEQLSRTIIEDDLD